MLLIDVYIDRSPIQGIGLFARNPVPVGTLIWKVDLRFDRLIPVADVEAASGAVRAHLDRYSYFRKNDTGHVLLEADDARFINHSDNPNSDFSEGDVAHALRDIAAGEEITCNYGAFHSFELLPDR